MTPTIETTSVTSIRTLEPEHTAESVTLEATVISLFDIDHSSIRQAGLIRDPSGVAKFTSWEKSDCQHLEEGVTYKFEDVSFSPDEYADEDRMDVSFRSKTTITEQFDSTRESYFNRHLPDDKNNDIDTDAFPVSLNTLTLDNPDFLIQTVEHGLENATVPWDETFIRNRCGDISRSDTADQLIKTRLKNYTESSVTFQRKYILPYESYRTGVDFYDAYQDFVDSDYYESEMVGMYSSRTLPLVAECSVCDERFDVVPYLDQHPVDDAEGNYRNWWYGGNGTEENEDFAQLDCPYCGEEAVWHEEHDYGSGPLRVPSIPKSVTFDWEIQFPTQESIAGVIEQVAETIGTQFSVRYTKNSILEQKVDKMNSVFGSDVFSVKRSGDVGARGLTRQYIVASFDGALTPSGFESLEEFFNKFDETSVRIQHNWYRTSSTTVNSWYYPFEKVSW